MAKIRRRQEKIIEFKSVDRDPLVLRALPPEAKLSEDSSSLTKKLNSQTEWMKQKGIDGRVAKSERPSSSRKQPRPGTLIYFSES